MKIVFVLLQLLCLWYASASPAPDVKTTQCEIEDAEEGTSSPPKSRKMPPAKQGGMLHPKTPGHMNQQPYSQAPFPRQQEGAEQNQYGMVPQTQHQQQGHMDLPPPGHMNPETQPVPVTYDGKDQMVAPKNQGMPDYTNHLHHNQEQFLQQQQRAEQNQFGLVPQPQQQHQGHMGQGHMKPEMETVPVTCRAQATQLINRIKEILTKARTEGKTRRGDFRKKCKKGYDKTLTKLEKKLNDMGKCLEGTCRDMCDRDVARAIGENVAQIEPAQIENGESSCCCKCSCCCSCDYYNAILQCCNETAISCDLLLRTLLDTVTGCLQCCCNSLSSCCNDAGECVASCCDDAGECVGCFCGCLCKILLSCDGDCG